MIAFAALAAAPSAYACACCAERDMWFRFNDRVDANELNSVQFGRLARVFVGGGGLEAIEGIRKPHTSYKLVVAKAGRSWTLKLGSAGALSFTLPARGEQYGVDLHDGKQSGGGGPLLYKELRLHGTARGSGDFKGGSYTLVLFGRGNVCLNAADYTRWRIEIDGKSAGYVLLGTFA